MNQRGGKGQTDERALERSRKDAGVEWRRRQKKNYISGTVSHASFNPTALKIPRTMMREFVQISNYTAKSARDDVPAENFDERYLDFVMSSLGDSFPDKYCIKCLSSITFIVHIRTR